MFKRLLISVSVFLVGVLVLFAVGVLWPLKEVVPINTNLPVVIKEIAVVDIVSGDVVEGQSIFISDQKISAIAAYKDLTLPEKFIEVNGEGKYVMPSLWDMHAHIYKITPMLDMPLYIAYGVTNVRDMTSCAKKNDPFVSCPEDLRALNDAAKQGLMVAPRIQGISSWMLNGPMIHDRIQGLPEFFGTANPKQARELVRYYSGRVNALKVYNDIPRDAYFALMDEAKKNGLEVIGHRPHAVSAIEAAAHQKSIEHARFILHESFPGSAALRTSAEKGDWHEDRRTMLDNHDPAMAQKIFKAMKESGTWYVPTHLTRWVDAYADDEVVLSDPNLRYMHPLLKWQWMEDVNKVIQYDPSPETRQTYREFYQKGLELTAAAHRAGVKVLVGTDYIVAGATVHDELEQFVLSGLTPLEALRSATVLPAEYFNLQNEYGQVREGFMADLILLDKNPLEDIRNTQALEAVIFNGNYYDKEKLEQLKSAVELRAKSWSIACKILWQFLKNPVNY